MNYLLLIIILIIQKIHGLRSASATIRLTKQIIHTSPDEFIFNNSTEATIVTLLQKFTNELIPELHHKIPMINLELASIAANSKKFRKARDWLI